MSDAVNHPPHYNNRPAEDRRRMTWLEKGGCKEKPCRKCGDDFKPETSGNLYCEGCRVTVARDCHARNQALWRAKEPERHRQIKLAWDLKTKWQMTIAEYDVMLAQQSSGCAICGSTETLGRGRLHVDHDHATGKIRGLLCNLCNRGLGAFRDNPDFLRTAAAYLEESCQRKKRA